MNEQDLIAYRLKNAQQYRKQYHLAQQDAERQRAKLEFDVLNAALPEYLKLNLDEQNYD